MRKVLYLSLALGLAAALIGCNNKAAVDGKAITDLKLADVRPTEPTPTASVGVPQDGSVEPIRFTPPPAPPPTRDVGPVSTPHERTRVTVVTPVPTQTPPMNYTVVKGDNLTRISRRFYGNDSMVKTIFNANRSVLKSPDLIKVGQKLFLPAKGSATVRSVSHTAPLAARTSRTVPKTHKVKKGESLFLIAKRIYGRGSHWTKIYEANKSKLKNPDRVREGMVLTIPSI